MEVVSEVDLPRGHKFRIYYDPEPENPREEWDNFGTMICFHNRYELGDKHHRYTSNSYSSWEDLEEELLKRFEIVVPLYLYDHSGLTIRMGEPFSCPWDSGQVGYIVVSKKDIEKEFGCEEDSLEKAMNLLASEVKTYDLYLRGEVFGYDIEDEDSCWGFIGSDFEYNGMLDYLNHEEDRQAVKDQLGSSVYG